jgi:hypothetical protein
MILTMDICKQFHYEIAQSYNKVIMCDIKKNVLIYFVITIYIIT